MDVQSFNLLGLKSKPQGTVITYVKSDFRESDLKQLGDNPRTTNHSEEYSVFSLIRNETDLTFMGTGSGSASLLSALFEVASSGLTRLVRIGACGGLNKTKVGEILVCDSTRCVDRISHILAGGPSAIPDVSLSTAIKTSIQTNRIEARFASNVSVDGMYLFETDLNDAEMAGVDCWDLETAAILSFSAKFGIKAASVLEVVSDRNGNSSESYPPLDRLDYVKAVMDAVTQP